MEEMIKILIGIIVLVMGIPIGNILASSTKDELKKGQRWFRLIIVVSLVSGFIGLIIGNDFLMFGFFFVAIVTSRSLKWEK
jgi:hypothetical protein